MKIGNLLAVLLISLGPFSAVNAQTFTPLSSVFDGLSVGTVDWGDYDGDGDLDLLLFGAATGEDIARLYRNDNGSFVPVADTFQAATDNSAAWGDFDSDGDLDFIMSYQLASEGEGTILYRNDGNDQFTALDISVPGLSQGYVDWGDFDNDGDQDFVIMGSGSFPLGDVTRVYRNDGGGVFTDIDAGLMDLRRGTVEWGDFDNDGDLDILQEGTAGFALTRTLLYRNDGGGTFTLVPTGLKGVYDGQAHWGDYDRDGDLDILIDGSDSTTDRFTIVYRNDGSGTFTDIGATLPVAGEGSSIGWGDCDNDGDLDVAITSAGTGFNDVYQYLSDSTYVQLNVPIQGICCGSLAWGDYDSDNDLDLVSAQLLSGTILYRNDIATKNTPPFPPNGLQSAVVGSTATLSWQEGSDPETGSAGLSYNLRVGTTPGGVDIVSPMSNPSTGYHFLADMGNVFENKSWKVVGLSEGTYFWSVQSIDNNFTGSIFAGEQIFVVGSPEYVCGDINLDGEGPDIADLIYLVDYMFADGPPPPMIAVADINNSGGNVDISDLIYFVDFMFGSGPAPTCG
jgi:hypothetical protein